MVKRKTLTLLAAVVLFGFSFTFSSCKACDKNDRSGKTSTEGDNKTTSGDDGNISGDGNILGNPKPKLFSEPKRELTLSDIEPLVDKAAKYAVDVCAVAAGDADNMSKAEEGEAATKRKNLEDLMKMPIMVEAEKSKNKNITDSVKAIVLLLERAKLAEKSVTNMARVAEYNAAILKTLTAKEAERAEQLKLKENEAQKDTEERIAQATMKRWKLEQEEEASEKRQKTADEALDEACKAWRAKQVEVEPDALNIARVAFVEEVNKRDILRDNGPDDRADAITMFEY
jgi:hypothetical protein